MAKHLALVCLLIALTGCGKLPIGMLGGGPNVAANTQVGRENVQQAVAQQTRTTAGRDVVTTTRDVEADQVDAVTINNDRVPIWLIVALVLGWLAPSPNEIGRGVRRLFKRRH
jgi:hypothetical protein